MAGRNTAKFEHETRLGRITEDYGLSTADIDSLSEVLGCNVDAEKLGILESLITIFKDVRKMSVASDVKSQDIKRTLTAMSKLDETGAIDAYVNCDIHTEARILRELYLINKGGETPLLRDAISRAQKRENEAINVGGQPSRKYIQQFVIEYLYLWKAWTDKPIDHSYDACYGKPPGCTLEWCSLLLEQATGHCYMGNKLKQIIYVNKGKVSGLDRLQNNT